MDQELIELARRLGETLKTCGLKMATAESCTGGLIAAAMTEIPGSSAWFERGFVTYSNEAKVELLGVNPRTLTEYGAVSAETAREMAAGALEHSRAEWAVAVTGIAGPDGGSDYKPVGTIYMAWQSSSGNLFEEKKLFDGDRRQVRMQTVKEAMSKLILFLQK